MAIIKPFRALRYDQKIIQTPISAVICPPYDVINPAMQQALYSKSPYNVVRIELGCQDESDTLGNDRYSRAAATLSDWMRHRILRLDEKQCFYLYEQIFDIASGGASRSRVVARRGIFGAIKLEPFGSGSVFPHEETFGGPKADRLKLMQACSAMLSPVFGLAPDEHNVLSALLKKGSEMRPPNVEITEENGVTNKLWAISDQKWCQAVTDELRSRNIYIADGHHRYETACNYRDERRKADRDPDGKLDRDYNYGLMMCVPMSDPGLYILPTHRLIQTTPGISPEVFLSDSVALFEQRKATEKDLLALVEEEQGAIKFGVIFKDGSRKILTAKSAVAAEMKNLASKKSDAWRQLDVSVLQELVLKGMLKLSEEKVLRKEGISYTPDARQAIAQVTAKDSHYALGFLLRPTLLKQVVAMQGEKMPQKSTYFYPKLLTGLVIMKL